MKRTLFWIVASIGAVVLTEIASRAQAPAGAPPQTPAAQAPAAPPARGEAVNPEVSNERRNVQIDPSQRQSQHPGTAWRRARVPNPARDGDADAEERDGADEHQQSVPVLRC